MLRWPSVIAARVRAESESVDLSDLLVRLDFHSDGRYYYGTLLGLTNPMGYVSRPSGEILAEFEDNRRWFPADYKVDIASCDPRLVVGVTGGSAFEAERTRAAASDMVASQAAQLWAQARNRHVRSSDVMIDLDDGAEDVVEALIPVRPS